MRHVLVWWMIVTVIIMHCCWPTPGLHEFTTRDAHVNDESLSENPFLRLAIASLIAAQRPSRSLLHWHLGVPPPSPAAAHCPTRCRIAKEPLISTLSTLALTQSHRPAAHRHTLLHRILDERAPDAAAAIPCVQTSVASGRCRAVSCMLQLPCERSSALHARTRVR